MWLITIIFREGEMLGERWRGIVGYDNLPVGIE
jgi:hypothetical protein